MQDALNQKRVVFYFNPVSYECVCVEIRMVRRGRRGVS